MPTGLPNKTDTMKHLKPIKILEDTILPLTYSKISPKMLLKKKGTKMPATTIGF
jgi:hypothetical protein